MANTRLSPPPDLNDEARAEWRRIVAEMGKAGRLERFDRPLLTVYVSLWSVHRAAATDVLKSGATCVLPNDYPSTTPEYDVLVKTAQQLRAILKELGLTPASRPKIAGPTTDELEI